MASPDRLYEEREVRNQALFREVNERIEEVLDRLDGRFDRRLSERDRRFLCECGRPGCNTIVRMSRDDYERLRAHSDRFVMAPGHEVRGVDEVVERDDGWAVVQLSGPGAELAEASDPRRRRSDADAAARVSGSTATGAGPTTGRGSWPAAAARPAASSPPAGSA